MSGPHSAAVLALILQRFPYMTNTQAHAHDVHDRAPERHDRDAGGPAAQNPTRGQIVQIPDIRNGWGTVSLREAMRGPGQLLGPTNIDTKGFSDVWSLDISDVAIRARQAEDAAEATAWAQKKIDKGWTNGVPDTASDQDKFDYATGVRREAARNARVYNGQPDQVAATAPCSSPAPTPGTGDDARWPAASCRSTARTRARSTSPAARSAASARWPAPSTSPAARCARACRPPSPRGSTTCRVPAGNVLKAGERAVHRRPLRRHRRQRERLPQLDAAGDVVLGGTAGPQPHGAAVARARR